MVSHVGYKAEEQDHLSLTNHACAGAVSGAVARAILQPLDVLKIRFQLQVEPIAKRGGGLYQGLVQSTYTIARTEGLSALWKGHNAAQALSITFGMAQCYTGMRNAVIKMVNQEGTKSLWKGLLPTLVMSAPYSGLVFYFYSAYQALMTKWLLKGKENEWLSTSAVTGLVAGGCAKTCVYPLDVLKKRLQIRGFEGAREQFGKNPSQSTSTGSTNT
ncbi:Mitochondrial thiamine pyrophosphate carrier [Portunus trituberculatus]|uniref:Mitochondrial thiamine pyrophosphate carrier n=1 Tax=Portunus trituberculatus TaxID=210409 RepID=A0A5B7EQZ4_PORTR|nr:Mitochondrial thiamine pyrophosphate carrier [Portunus trituberculatus]